MIYKYVSHVSLNNGGYFVAHTNIALIKLKVLYSKQIKIIFFFYKFCLICWFVFIWLNKRKVISENAIKIFLATTKIQEKIKWSSRFSNRPGLILVWHNLIYIQQHNVLSCLAFSNLNPGRTHTTARALNTFWNFHRQKSLFWIWTF